MEALIPFTCHFFTEYTLYEPSSKVATVSFGIIKSQTSTNVVVFSVSRCRFFL